MKQEFEITGMSCGHCVSAVRSVLEQLDGVTVVDVSLGGASIEVAPGIGVEGSAEGIVRAAKSAIEDEGYSVVSSKAVQAVDEE